MAASVTGGEIDIEEYAFLAELNDKLKLDPHFLETLPQEKLVEINKRANRVYGELPNRPTGKYCVMAITNLTQDYLYRLGLLGTVGYMYNQARMYEPEVPEALLETVTDPMDKEKVKRAFWEDARKPINKFLDQLFKFDPDRHVSKFGDSVKIEDVELPHEPFKGQRDYIEVFGSKLREILDKKVYGYPQRVDNIAYIYAAELTSYEDAKREYDVAKKMTQIPLYVVEQGRFVAFGEINQKIRKELDVDAPGNEILQQILERQKQDDELKKKILQKRVRTVKLENIKAVGPDDPEFIARVRELHPDRAINSDVFTPEEIRRLNEEWKNKEMEKHRKEDETIFPIKTIDGQTGEVKEAAIYSAVERYVAD